MSHVLPPISPPQAGYDRQQHADLLLRALDEQRRLLDAAEACVRRIQRGETLADSQGTMSTLTLLVSLRERERRSELS